MKCISLVLLLIIDWTLAGVIQTPIQNVAIVNTGESTQYRSQDSLGNYAFGYNEDHATGGTFRREAGNALGQVVGSYGLRGSDGRLRIVNYIADDTGFRADINTNEPGVEPKDPASATINKGPGTVVVQASAPAAVQVPLASTKTVVQQPIVQAPIVQQHVAAPVIPQAQIIQQAPIVQAPVAAPVKGLAPIAYQPPLQVKTPVVQTVYQVPAAPALAAPAPVKSVAPAIVSAPRYLAPVAQRPIAQPPIQQAPIQQVVEAPVQQVVEAPVRQVVQAPVQQYVQAPPTPITQVREQRVEQYPEIQQQVEAAPVKAPLAVAPSVAYGPAYGPAYGRPAYAPAPLVASPSQTSYELVNTYAHPAAYGYSLGIPSNWGYTYILKKKKK